MMITNTYYHFIVYRGLSYICIYFFQFHLNSIPSELRRVYQPRIHGKELWPEQHKQIGKKPYLHLSTSATTFSVFHIRRLLTLIWFKYWKYKWYFTTGKKNPQNLGLGISVKIHFFAVYKSNYRQENSGL